MEYRILIVRTSSLGDIIHVLPAISDIAEHFPESIIDWVVEENFLEIPRWHSKINSVISVAQRRWRASWWSNQVRLERRALITYFQENPYDLILDMQGLLKSAFLVRRAIGQIHGLDWNSSRECLASCFYHKKHNVNPWQGAITRQRLLASLAFGYKYSGPPNFGFKESELQLRKKKNDCYVVLMPSASRKRKLWLRENWIFLIKELRSLGYNLILLAGNEKEKCYAESILLDSANSEILTGINLTSIKNVLLGAQFMIGLDTGLTHLSAALGIPTLGIYCASSSLRTGLVGRNFVANLGNQESPPLLSLVVQIVRRLNLSN